MQWQWQWQPQSLQAAALCVVSTSFLSRSGSSLLSLTILVASADKGVGLRMSKTEISVWNSFAIHALISTAISEFTATLSASMS
jgi:hypothetical protein